MTCTMSLQTLLEGWCEQVPHRVVSGLCLDAQQIEEGQAFVAVSGGGAHGMTRARQAETRGAAVVIHDGQTGVPELSIPHVAVPDLEQRLSELGARFFRNPSDQLDIAGVAGGEGKASTTHFIAQSWQRAEGQAGIAGSAGCGPLKSGALAHSGASDAIGLQAVLARCIDHGVGKVALEVSSHALGRGHYRDITFDVAVFSGAGQGTDSEPLFLDGHPRFAVVNHDDAAGKALSRQINNGTQVLSFGTNGSTELRGSILGMDSAGMTLSIASPWGGGELQTGLMGRSNLSGLLAAAGTLALMGMPWNQVMHQLEIMRPLPGRMHCLGGEPGQPVIVMDDADTPEMLGQALEALRSHLHGRLTCVFGCSSELGAGQRRMMARAAEALADRVVMTAAPSDGADPFAIFADMMKGLKRPGEARLVPDRADAIRRAVAESGTGDIVLVAGRSREDWQATSGRNSLFNDETTVRELLEEVA